MPELGWLTQPAVFPWAALAVGLGIGSFLNVVIHRLPKMMEREWLADIPDIIEESSSIAHAPDAKRLAGEIRTLTKAVVDTPVGLVAPRSRCPKCGHQITAIENIPVLSYLALRGKCAACRSGISPRYPLVELLAGVGAWYCAYHFGFGMQALAAAVFLWSTIALALIDHETGYLPDTITLPLVWFGLLVNLDGVFVPLKDAVIGAAAAYLVLWSINAIFKLVRGMDGMGHGDFKLYAAVGAFFGWKILPLIILISSVVGLLFGTLQMFAARSGWDWKFRFHFGPYIALAGIIAMFWGSWLAQTFPVFRFYG
jgi:leader peptidase (prepilin peptidase)/N-methyltransferase